MVCVLSSPAVCSRGEKGGICSIRWKAKIVAESTAWQGEGCFPYFFDSKIGAIYLRLGEQRAGQGEAVATVRAPDCIILSAR